MPLSQHDASLDYDGSWADASKGWPEMKFRTDDHCSHATYVAWKRAKVPYGSYVTMGTTLRLEDRKYIPLVRAALQKHPYREDWKERIR